MGARTIAEETPRRAQPKVSCPGPHGALQDGMKRCLDTGQKGSIPGDATCDDIECVGLQESRRANALADPVQATCAKKSALEVTPRNGEIALHRTREVSVKLLAKPRKQRADLSLMVQSFLGVSIVVCANCVWVRDDFVAWTGSENMFAA
jgi:hypothetical protein